ncbi:protein cycle isoform X3 [Planococcus citri]|uniref:protein cycle isoform X3 n=1 Tax=Planococcus citri TaxID=170843 RepID=UPI0031F738FF
MEVPFSEPNLEKSRAVKKRKGSTTLKTNCIEDQDTEESKSTSDMECKRQIHSKIEKRRRDKMNTYISQLSTMIPSCNFNTHKLDKITVLRMAVQYLKSIRTSPMQCNAEENLKYSFISDVELKKLILQVSEGFLFVVGCDSGRILFVSESVSTMLNSNRSELLGRSLYDIIHPSDIDKVKEQISCADLNPRHKLMASKSVKELEIDLPSEQLGLHPGNRRSFYFRIKSDVDDSGKYAPGTKNFQFYKNTNAEQMSPNTVSYNPDQNDYTVIHSVGYLKCWNSSTKAENPKYTSADSSSMTCFIAVGRTISNFPPALQMENPSKFDCKHTVDGKFLFVDHWFTLITGFLSQEILGTSIYEYIHSEDVNEFAEAHRSMLQPFNCSNTIKNFRFRTKFSHFINVSSEWKSLENPWKKDVEYFYSTNTVKWTNETSVEEKPEGKQSANLARNDLFTFPSYESAEKSEQNLIDNFNFHPTICEKNSNEATMEAIMKLLESDTNIAD